jgi:hypothetical protein
LKRGNETFCNEIKGTDAEWHTTSIIFVSAAMPLRLQFSGCGFVPAVDIVLQLDLGVEGFCGEGQQAVHGRVGLAREAAKRIEHAMIGDCGLVIVGSFSILFSSTCPRKREHFTRAS